MTIYSSDSQIYPFNETPLLIYQDSVLLNSTSIKIYLYIRNITEIRKNLVSSTIPSPNLKNDFYGCWVEAQNPRNALGFASLNPTYKNGEGIVQETRF
jgi:hypothetical protein